MGQEAQEGLGLWAQRLLAEPFCSMSLSAGTPGPLSRVLWCNSPENFSDHIEASTVWGFLFKSPLAFLLGTPRFTWTVGLDSSPRGSLLLIHWFWILKLLQMWERETRCLIPFNIGCSDVFFPLHFRQLKQTDFPMWETILGLEPSNATLCAGRDRGRDSGRRRIVVVSLALLCLLFILGTVGETWRGLPCPLFPDPEVLTAACGHA